ncbi:hypothetical protein F7725_001452 [Dissostichus mawsoni]|uniref:Uncharacterized protein n=1 Tax=Dissostichus mawsoni TaxID=36200 RepID=A0A7J5ZKH7_DISMA|nr:hypothetical protein F7725_001452 [Dissostichus mawsoni]
MFWSCPSLSSFWASVFRSLSAISGRILSPNPQTAIFGTVDTGLGFSSLHKNAVAYASLHARRLILLNWKGKNPPSYIHWIREVMLGNTRSRITVTADPSATQEHTLTSSAPRDLPLILQVFPEI